MKQNLGFILLDAVEDNLGYTHVKMRPTTNAVPVIGMDAVVEMKDGVVVNVFDDRDADLSMVDTTPTLSAGEALSVAKREFVPLAHYPQPKDSALVVFVAFSDTPVLCWQFTDEADHTVFLNARSGELISRIPNFCSVEQTTSVDVKTTYYNAVGNLTGIYQTSNGNYYLKDSTRGNVTVESNDFYAPRDDLYIWGTLSSRTRQFNYTTQPSKAAGDAFFAYQQVWDYFKNTHGRNGWNGSGAGNGILVGWPYVDAQFRNSDKGLRFGTTNGAASGNPFTTLDVVGHEYTHGIVYGTAGLLYVNEPGSLNESFADIFGTATEFYAQRLSNTTIPTLNFFYVLNRPAPNFLIGEESGRTFRSMANPPTVLSNGVAGVDNYNNRITDPNFDFGGVHYNCGIQNKVHYLLSQGGTHNGVSVSAIGRDKSEKIFYRTLTMKLTGGSGFVSSRRGSIAAAEELYGLGSNEANQARAAWNSVQVPQ